jgi:hypothetical protein
MPSKLKLIDFFNRVLGVLVLIIFTVGFIFLDLKGTPGDNFLIANIVILIIFTALFINPVSVINYAMKMRGQAGDAVADKEGVRLWRRVALYLIIMILIGIFFYIKRFGLVF